jgi:hypothetical protein
MGAMLGYSSMIGAEKLYITSGNVNTRESELKNLRIALVKNVYLK